MRNAWEYKTITGKSDDWTALEAQLNQAGREGWEAVGITPSTGHSMGGWLGQHDGYGPRPLAVLLKRPIDPRAIE